MARRKWLLRSLGLGLLGGVAVAAWLYYACTNPEAVRLQVIAHLQSVFPDADVQIDGASLRLLGGVWLHGVRLTRRDDPAHGPFLEAPAALLVHDKEHFARYGELRLRKLELIRPRLRLERRPDGHWSLDGLLRPGPPGQPQPIIAVREGELTMLDQLGGVQRPAVVWRDCQVTLINDPADAFSFELRAAAEQFGPITGRGCWQRSSGAVALALDLPAVPVGPLLARTTAPFAPDLAEYLAGLSGVAAVHTDLRRPAAGAPWRHDLRASLRRGAFRHPRLPLPATEIEASASCANGTFTLDRLTARLDTSTLEPAAAPARLDLALQLRPPGVVGNTAGLEERFQAATARLTGLPLTDELFRQLPEEFRHLGPEFQPAGPVDLTYRLERTAHGWTRHCSLVPKGVSSTYELYRYPIRDLRGRMDQVVTDGGEPVLTYELTGTANDRPLLIKGRREGEGPTASVTLDITGTDLLLEAPMINALPERFAALGRQFHLANVRGDVAVRFVRQHGSTDYARHFLITFKDGALKYDVFPYPLENLRGVLDIAVVPTALASAEAAPPSPDAPPPFGAARRDHCLFRGLEGSHRGARMALSGQYEYRPDGDRMVLNIQGRELPLDSELASALAAVKLTGAWESLAPRGRLNFNARVVNRYPPGQDGLPDLDLGLSVAGATIQPTFFPFEIAGIEGSLHYAHDRVELTDFRAVHGTTRMTLSRGDLRLKPHSGVWADLSEISLAPLPVEGDFLTALPKGIREVLSDLEVRGTVSLHATKLTIDAATGGPPAPEEGPFRLAATGTPARPETPPEPWIYWDGTAALHGITLRTGVPWEGVVGTVASRGEHKDGKLCCLRGGLWLEQARLYRQPVQQLVVGLYVDPKEPGWLQVPYLTGRLFDGEVGGEGRLSLGEPLTYDLRLTAAGLRLDEVARHNQFGPNTQLSGQASARLHLAGHGEGLAGLTGSGSVDVPAGRIQELPLLIDLLKVMHGRAPDRTAFEEAHADFQVHGPRVQITKLDLFGDAISLGGEGSVNLDDQSVKLNFYGIWSQFFRAFPEPVRELTAGISQNLFQFEVRGKLDDLKSNPVPVPALVDPLRELIARLQRRGRPPVTRASGQ